MHGSQTIARANSIANNLSKRRKSLLAGSFGQTKSRNCRDYCTEIFSFLHVCKNVARVMNAVERRPFREECSTGLGTQNRRNDRRRW